MRRYPLAYSRSSRLRLRKKKIVFFFLLAVVVIIIGIGFNTITVFNSITNQDKWATNLTAGVKNSPRINYLCLLLQKKPDNMELQLVYFLSNHETSSYALVLPSNILIQEETTLADAYVTSGTSGVINGLIRLLGEPVHYYITLDSYNLFSNLKKIQKLESPLPGQFFSPTTEEEKQIFIAEISKREREVLAFIKELAEVTPFWRWPSLVRESLPFMETNLTWRQISILLDGSKKFALPSNWQVDFLPGKWVISNVVDNKFSHFLVDKMSLSFFFDFLSGKTVVVPREQITIEVLNGSGFAGVASQAAHFLREAGFRVTRIDNADHFDYLQTQVISRQENMSPAKDIAVNLQGADLLQEIEPFSEVMVTVIIGQNFGN